MLTTRFPLLNKLRRQCCQPRQKMNFLLVLIVTVAIVFIFRFTDIFEMKEEDPSYRYAKNTTITPSKPIQLNGSFNKPHACPIPQLDPFDPRILHLLNKNPAPDWNCEAKYRLLFQSTLDSTIIPWKGPDHIRREGYVSCCYRTVEGAPFQEKGDPIRLSSKCFPLSITFPTRIPDEHELLAIYCKQIASKHDLIPVDLIPFVAPPKPRKDKVMPMTQEEGKLNVVIFGVDSTSRMNLIRNMPQTYAFLKDQLDAVEMLGYNKVGESTFPNLLPFLTSKTELEPSPDGSWPSLWKSYSDKGYYTAVNEELPTVGLIDYLKPAFQAHPTDHYIFPLLRWGFELGNICSHLLYEQWCLCFGPRLAFPLLLDYMEKYIHRMSDSKVNFFHVMWSSALTHNYQTGALIGDPHLVKTLKRLKHSGYLNNTLLILMSDHGSRLEAFRNTIQGQLEDRLPAMLLLFPESFKKKYSRAYRNLLGNRDKLMTVFDLHETLLDILNLENLLEEAALEGRELQAAERNSSSLLPRGLSLFLPIPPSRTCEMAGIELNFCSCNFMSPTSLQDDPSLPHIAQVAVSHINSLLKQHHHHPPQCSQLQLRNLTLAQRTQGTSSGFEAYIINFVTDPGGASFEALVEKPDTYNHLPRKWAVQGAIVRTNPYGTQSHCVVDKQELKPYCYCSGSIIS